MSKAEDRALEAYPPKFTEQKRYSKRVRSEKTDVHQSVRAIYTKGYHQAEKDIKEELSKLFQEFTLDCINDDKDIHILHFMDVFSNKIKTIGNE